MADSTSDFHRNPLDRRILRDDNSFRLSVRMVFGVNIDVFEKRPVYSGIRIGENR